MASGSRSKAKDSPTAPFPVTLQRTIPKPEAASAFDVEELRLQLLVASSDRATMPISVQVAGELPPTVQKRIAAHVEARWREEIEARGAAPGWMLEKILGWAEGAYADLLWLEPTYVEQYEGCDDAGMTIRRYAIAEPPEAKEEASEEEAAASEEEEESSSEDEEVARQRRIKEKAEAEADRQWREERRLTAVTAIPHAPQSPHSRRCRQRISAPPSVSTSFVLLKVSTVLATTAILPPLPLSLSTPTRPHLSPQARARGRQIQEYPAHGQERHTHARQKAGA